MELKYLVVGAGAIGGITAAMLTKSGKNVTLIARGENYAVIREKGIHVQSPEGDYQVPVKASRWDEYTEIPDVVLLCVKAYSLDSVVEDLDRVCDEHTIIVPLMNALNIGGELTEKMKTQCTILGGAVYISVVRDAPGYIRKKLGFSNFVIGMRNGEEVCPELLQIKSDFEETGAKFLITNNPVKAVLRKFFRVSVVSGVTCYYNAPVGEVRSHPEGIQLFKDMCGELKAIGEAMGDPFTQADEEPFPGKPVDEETFDNFMSVFPEYQSSMKNDWDAGRPTEIKQQILDVIDLGHRYGVSMPAYEKVAKKLLAEQRGGKV